MRRTFLLLVSLVAIATAHAKATFSLSGNTLTITTESAGELNAHNWTSQEKTATILVLGGHYNWNELGNKITNVFGQKCIIYDLSKAVIDDYASISSGNYRIANMAKMQTLILPEAYDYVPANICKNQSGPLQKVVLPSHCKKIGANAFEGCSSLQTISFPNSITEIGAAAFKNAKLTSIRLPDNLAKIEAETFRGCQWLNSVVIPENVKSIGANAFQTCNRLRDVYCLSKEAPTWEAQDVFDKTTLCNSKTGAEQYHGVYDKTTNVIQRRGYWQGNMDNVTHIGCAVLHIPNDLTAEQLALYADDTKINLQTGSYAFISEYGDCRWPSWSQLEEGYKNEQSWRKFAVVSFFTPSKDEKVVPNLYDDTWYTIVLPFSMTKDEVERTFGAGTELCKFVGIRSALTKTSSEFTLDFSLNTNQPTVFEGTVVKANDPMATILEANVPYMIRPLTSPDETGKVTFRFVGIKGMDVEGDDKLLAEGVLGTKDGKEDYLAGYRFVGTYNTNVDKRVIPYGYYFLSRVKKGEKEKAYYLETSTNPNRTTGLWKANTCCIVPPASATLLAKNMFSIMGPDNEYSTEGETTDISSTFAASSSSLTQNTKYNKVYNLNGQLVSQDGDLHKLPQGIYIVNGRKYIVR